MNDYKNFCEYSVCPEKTGKLILARVLLMIFYVAFTLAYLWIFALNFKAFAIVILLPFIMYAIIKLTWRLTVVEYDFAIEAGELTVAKIYAGSARRVKARAYVPDMTLIAPKSKDSERVLSASDIVSVKDFSAQRDSETAFVCVYPDRSGGKKRALVIETNEEMQRVLRLCNPSAFVRTH